MMMMKMIMMMNCCCGMVDWWKVFSLIFSQDHCQRSSPSWISDTLQAGFEPVQNLSSGLVEWSCAVVITTTPWHHKIILNVIKACVCYFSLFLKEMYFFVILNKVHWKKFNLQLFFSSHCFTNIYSLWSYHVLPASLKLLV